MNQLPKNLEQLLGSPEAAKLMGNKGALDAITKSPEAQKLMQLLNQTSGGNLQAVTEAAKRGDTSQLGKLLSEVSKNPELSKTVSDLGQKLSR